MKKFQVIKASSSFIVTSSFLVSPVYNLITRPMIIYSFLFSARVRVYHNSHGRSSFLPYSIPYTYEFAGCCPPKYGGEGV